MKIIRKSCAQGALGAKGLVVIIDVFRAFSCEPLFFYFNARKVILEPDPEKAQIIKREHPTWILVGEHNEVPLPEADFGNSPSEILSKGKPFFRDKTIIHRSTAGVTGVAAALPSAEEVLLGSFLTAKATAAYIQEKRPKRVTLVVIGERGQTIAPEDEACADYLEHILTGRAYDGAKVLKHILFQKTAKKFFAGDKSHLPPEDVAICLQRDLFDFVLIAKWVDGQIIVEKIIDT
jgi:2-phosphosulfolactate phosphatase